MRQRNETAKLPTSILPVFIHMGKNSTKNILYLLLLYKSTIYLNTSKMRKSDISVYYVIYMQLGKYYVTNC